uniref:G_PROTEIN_RECEP_F1_2 domain-containing protein n=1 Tax=Caenorhabditis tropicalis TaxID=1561998 RepID=A0A1I7UTY7_9PELO
MGLGLFNWLGVSNMIQLISGVIQVLIMTQSYIFVFETRTSSLLMNRFKMTRTSTRILYHGLLYLVNSLIILALLATPHDQEAAKLDALKRDPCPTVEFFENDILVVLTDKKTIDLVLLSGIVLLIHIIFHILFHVICTVYHLYIVPPKSSSIETRKKQQKFFIGIIFQTIIPLTLLWSLLVIVIVDEITHNVTQELVNLTMIMFSLHGIVESVAVLSVHQSYRRAVWRMITRENHDSKND